MSATVPAGAAAASPRVDLRVLARHGEQRDRHLAAAEAELDAIVTELERAQQAGGRINVSLAARLAGVTRDTIYARLRARSTENTTNPGGTA